MITAKEAKNTAKLPAELENLDALIRRSSREGKPGIWLEISIPAQRVLREAGYEVDVTSNEFPGKHYIYWGN